uniref:Uncharacterized protein n=1 Tax=Candidatus Berkiella aquae TaxID=295108 RepID=A0A0Q9YSQ1_9GAMM
MRYSENYVWFKNVLWQDKGIIIDCLADISQCLLPSGPMLIQEGESLIIYTDPLIALASKQSECLGCLLRWSYPVLQIEKSLFDDFKMLLINCNSA